MGKWSDNQLNPQRIFLGFSVKSTEYFSSARLGLFVSMEQGTLTAVWSGFYLCISHLLQIMVGHAFQLQTTHVLQWKANSVSEVSMFSK